MNKYLFIISSALIALHALAARAQDSQGAINYEVKVKLPPMNDGDGESKYFSNNQQLFFNENESLYAPAPDEESEYNNSEGGMQIQLVVPQNEIYHNKSTFSKIALMEFMGKKYLVTDTMKMRSWKFGNDTKVILGYSCKMATFNDDSTGRKLVAWYTDKLRPFLGPEDFDTLPGAVLQVDINDGQRVVTATKIDLRPLKKGELKIPKGGNPISGPAYDSMVQEQVKKMGNNGERIIINH